MKQTAIPAALLIVIALAGCGFLAEKGEESRGTSNLPSQGIGPWVKYDLECPEEQCLEPGEPPNLDFQPIVIPNPAPMPLSIYPVLAEPWALAGEDDRLLVYYEERRPRKSVIRRAEYLINPAVFCRPMTFDLVEDAVVFEPDRGLFERGRVGAPTILEGTQLPGVAGLDTTYAMYYEGGDGRGIGLAVSPDGRNWTRVGHDGQANDRKGVALVEPTNGWERRSIGSPAILRRPAGDFLLYFDGDHDRIRSIGVAASEDGVNWTRVDNSEGTGPDAAPILTPTFEGPKEQTNWEFKRSWDPDSGSVGTPMVLLDRGPIRDVYIMYYTGNLRGDLGHSRDRIDSSIGVAFSYDGITFEKASTEVVYPYLANEVNPVLNELFPLCIVRDDLACIITALEPFFEILYGDDGLCEKPEYAETWLCQRFDPGDGEPGSGSSNSMSPFIAIDEAEPCVVQFGQKFLLLYHQQSNIFTFFDGGIAMATNNF